MQGKARESLLIKGNDLSIVAIQGDFREEGNFEFTIDPQGNYLFAKTTNEYDLKYPITGDRMWRIGDFIVDQDNYDVGGTKGNGAAFCLLRATTAENYELSSSPISLKQEMTYDEFGRIIQYTHNNGEYKSNITYFDIQNDLANLFEEKNVLSIPKTISINDETSLRRKREVVDVDENTGDIKDIAVFYNIDASNSTKMNYDQYGNLIKIQYPSAQNNIPLIRDYSYDDVLHQFLNQTSDNFGFTSSVLDYNYKFGVPSSTIDITGNSVTYEYDPLGRITLVKGPKDPVYTLKMEYHPEHYIHNVRPYATTDHYDGENPIRTVSIGNGLGQVAQIKKDIALHEIGAELQYGPTERVSISGITEKDIFGRSVVQHYPILGNNNNFEFIALVDPNKSSVVYDELDRVTDAFDFSGNHTKLSYSLDQGLMKQRSEIQQNSSTWVINEVLKDINGRTAISKQISELYGELVTTNKYDGIGQIMNVTNSLNQVTSYEYDFAGNLTARNHPDSHRDEYTYDNLGQILTHTNANNVSQGNQVTYIYDALSRIIEVNYPHSINNVFYSYYGPNEGNNTGKLKRIEDGTGIREYAYGNMGEIELDTRTIMAPDMKTRTFRTRFKYDSWNRLKEITYPDDETVVYGYDYGGNLYNINNYINLIAYDLFEQKTFEAFANETSNRFDYTDGERRIKSLKTLSGTQESLLDMKYYYDNIGNIENKVNEAYSSSSQFMGGRFSDKYNYDDLNQLISASGSWKGDHDSSYRLVMKYDNLHRIVSKKQLHATTSFTEEYDYKYNYKDSNHPNAVTNIMNPNNPDPNVYSFNYDEAGNINNQFNHINGNDNTIYWDDNNMMRGIVMNDAEMQHYIYDASGERTLKANGVIIQVSNDGQQLVTNEGYLGNYTTYPNGFITISPEGIYTKHYYEGAQRIASTIAGSAWIFENTDHLSDNYKLKDRQINDINQIFEEEGFDHVMFLDDPIFELDCYNYEEGSEAQKQCLCYSNPNECKDIRYFFHSDHLGSSTFLTDNFGNPYEFILYLPWGEIAVHQKVGDFSTPYKFTSKELDAETGLYYYGARYYDPELSMFYGVDPLADLAPNKTPYHYTSNNPINRIDPDGRNDDWVGEDDGCGNITWKWDASITSLDQAKAAGYDAYQAPGSTLEGSRIGSELVAPIHFGGTQAEGIGYDESNFTNWNNINGSSYGNQLEAYRAWQSESGYHRGEEYWDRTFRVMAYGSMEARRDFASGGMNMYGGYGRSLFNLNPSKFEYFFGRVVSGSQHNIARSAQNLKDLTTLGITTESQLISVFNQAARSGSVVSTNSTQYGTTIMRSVNVGNKGSIDVGFFYKGGNTNSVPSITTIIPKIFK